jgi:type I restriction enzyme S subunit
MRVRPDKSQVIPEFLALWCRSPWARKFFMSRAKQVTMTTISQPDIAPLPVPLPSKSEQESIVEIHDAVSNAIAHTSSLIAKLKQMKAGLLHDLLTRGLDENGELRDAIMHPEQFKESPLGQIPKEWEVKSLDAVCLNVVDCPHTTPVFRREGVLIARTSNIRNGIFDIPAASYVSEQEYRQRITRLEPQSGDIIFTREAPVAEAFIIPECMQICLGQRTMLLRPSPEKAHPGYILAQIYSGTVKVRINQLVGGTTNPHLNVGDVRSFLLPVPPLQEQAQIAAILDVHNDRIHTEEVYRDKIVLQKKGLMHDLLTGKVRVNIANKSS